MSCSLPDQDIATLLRQFLDSEATVPLVEHPSLMLATPSCRDNPIEVRQPDDTRPSFPSLSQFQSSEATHHPSLLQDNAVLDLPKPIQYVPTESLHSTSASLLDSDTLVARAASSDTSQFETLGSTHSKVPANPVLSSRPSCCGEKKTVRIRKSYRRRRHCILAGFSGISSSGEPSRDQSVDQIATTMPIHTVFGFFSADPIVYHGLTLSLQQLPATIAPLSGEQTGSSAVRSHHSLQTPPPSVINMTHGVFRILNTNPTRLSRLHDAAITLDESLNAAGIKYGLFADYAMAASLENVRPVNHIVCLASGTAHHVLRALFQNKTFTNLPQPTPPRLDYSEIGWISYPMVPEPAVRITVYYDTFPGRCIYTTGSVVRDKD